MYVLVAFFYNSSLSQCALYCRNDVLDERKKRKIEAIKIGMSVKWLGFNQKMHWFEGKKPS